MTMNKKWGVFCVPFFILLLGLSAGLHAQFARTYGGPGSDRPVRILTTPDGGFVVFGNSSSFAGKTWVLRLAGDGTVQWEKAYATPAVDSFYSSLATPDGGYLLAGGSNADLWLVKTGASGEPEWQRLVANNASSAGLPYGLCPAGESGYFVVGYTNSSVDYDAWVIRLSSGGDVIWQKAYGLTGWESAVAAASSGDGGCVVVGKSDAAGQGRNDLLVFHLNAEGAVSWQKTFSMAGFDDFEAPTIRRTGDGGYVLTGWLFAAGNPLLFVIKLGEAGTVEWGRPYRIAGGFDIQETSAGGFIVVGDWNSDIMVMKLDAGGAIEWQRAFGGVFPEEGAAVVQTAGGDYAATGNTPSFGAGGDDFLVVRFSAEGELGSCRLQKNSGVEASTGEISETPISLSVQDTAAAIQDVDYAVFDTSGTSQTYPLCTSQKLLTMSSDPMGPAPWTSPEVGSHLYPAGATVTISATASVSSGGSTYNFSSWSGDVATSANPTTVEMTDDMSVRANYSVEWGDGGDGGDGDGGGDWGNNGGNRGHCFVATAAYRSPLHPAVRLLRDFRDKRLLTNGIGRAFVEAYYRWSPPAARVIAGSSVLRLVARVALIPAIAIAAIVLKLGWLASLLLMTAILAVGFRKVLRKRWARAA
jgi:hypothetical protein